MENSEKKNGWKIWNSQDILRLKGQRNRVSNLYNDFLCLAGLTEIRSDTGKRIKSDKEQENVESYNPPVSLRYMLYRKTRTRRTGKTNI